MGQNKKDLIKSAKAFEFYVSKIWPLHRLFVKSKLSTRCVNCAASEHMITLNDKQVCELCEHTQVGQSVEDIDTSADLAVFNELLSNTQGEGAYDVLVPYSGGKDSSYLIHRIQKEFPSIRILAFTVDNGFMSPVAKENVETLLLKLNVNHLFITPAPDFYKKLFRYGITHLNDEGGYGTVDFSDGEFILDTARNIATEKKIPLILCGYSKYQVINGLKIKTFEYPKSLENKDRQYVAGMPLSAFHDEHERAQWWQGNRHQTKAQPRLLFPLYCWDLEEEEILASVKKQGLVCESISPIVTNHLFIPVLGVVDVHKFGYSSYEPEFCRMIRDGKAEHIHWRNTFEFLEYTSRNGLFVGTLCTEMLAQVDLTLSDVGVEFS
jgi:hypothetical protein